MALPKKRSKSITVDKQQYRYIISTGKYNDECEFDLNITVQVEDGEGAKLKVKGLVTRNFWLDLPNDVKPKEAYPVVTPKDISIIIKNSIKEGWKPNEKGDAFIIHLENPAIEDTKNDEKVL